MIRREFKEIEKHVYMFFDYSKVKIARKMIFFNKLPLDKLKILEFCLREELGLVIKTEVSMGDGNDCLTGSIWYKKPVKTFRTNRLNMAIDSFY